MAFWHLLLSQLHLCIINNAAIQCILYLAVSKAKMEDKVFVEIDHNECNEVEFVIHNVVILLVEIDHNECNEGGVCSHGQCVNTDGSFKCLCDTGFILSSSGKECAGQLWHLHTQSMSR